MSTATAADDIQLVPPPGSELFHLGRRSEPFWWHLPEPLDLTADPVQTAAGRFDDPNGEYATLYCATDYYGALLETLAPLRPVPGLSEQIDQALEESPDPEHDLPIGSKAFPSDFLDTKVMGIMRVDSAARFVDVDHPRTHAALEQHGGAALLKTLRVGRIDRGAFMSPDRRLTRQAAHALHELLGGRAVGLRYLSALDPNVECWAIWDRGRASLYGHDVEPIDATSKDLQRVIERYGFDPLTSATNSQGDM